MNTKEYKTRVIVTACSLAFAALSGLASAQTTTAPEVTTANAPITLEDARDALDQVNEAVQVVLEMERDEGMRQLLQQARGVFILPDYGRAALGVGVRGGEGVLLVKRNGTWSDPAFYNMGGVSVGLQAGIKGGDIAFVLNNQRAVDSFMQQDNWSLNADAGLTIVAWSAKAQAAAGKGDVVAWSDTEGLFANIAVSVTDINFDEDETASYYGRQVALRDIVNGKVDNPHSQILKQALAGAAMQTSGAPAGMVVSVPATLLVPMEIRDDPALSNGCWARLIATAVGGATSGAGSTASGQSSGASAQSSGAQGAAGTVADLTVAGDMELPTLQTPTGVDWSRKTDQIVVGPNATVTVFADESFQGKSQTLKPGERISDVRGQLGFPQSIDSLRVSCRT